LCVKKCQHLIIYRKKYSPSTCSDKEIAIPSQAAHRCQEDGVEDRANGITIVGIGASAGGLDVFREFLDAMSADTGMAFVLVQHLDPSHDSLIAELLSGYTKMPVRQASQGMPIEPNSVYVIPPGVSLTLGNGLFKTDPSVEEQGARLPFDLLLQSLAGQVGERAIGVVLSGNGTDGSVGLRAIKRGRGFIIAQEPDEAGFDGMPRSAIETGLVDRVLPVADIPGALISYDRWLRRETRFVRDGEPASEDNQALLRQIVELLRLNSAYDFTPYKHGTLQRRIERRMSMSAIEPKHMDQYLRLLENNSAEIEALAKDMLINVTNFFRDAKTFDLLSKQVVPEMVAKARPGVPIRIWSVGCSSGEEIYSLIMIFLEQITLSERPISLQVFASDLDPDAIRTAREGLYPKSISEDVSPQRLARFFTLDRTGYRVSQRMRDLVTFTVQDILKDPPFSQIDMISCRNLLIYLSPEAQARVISMLAFSLKDEGILLLGASETLARHEGLFQPLFKEERIYRQTGGGIKRFPAITSNASLRLRSHPYVNIERIAPAHILLADLCRRLVLESFAPASVLVNPEGACVFTLGAIEPYLRVVSGHPTNDILAMSHDDVRGHLREAILLGRTITERMEVEGGRIKRGGKVITFGMTVQPVQHDGEEYLLICFVEAPGKTPELAPGAAGHNSSLVAKLEKELAARKIELTTAQYNIEILTEEQAAFNAETMSVNEELQATNEELLTSKEELQSLNEELSALNTQLQESLEQQRRTSSDLQNVLVSTDVATIFLDTGLNIRFFTPAARSVFNIIKGDIGRPLSDLSPLSADAELQDDCRYVLERKETSQREVRAVGDKWFNRRILPYIADDGQIDGVVITYNDISDQKQAAQALNIARQAAEISNASKSEFLAAASHDLRQPLQTLLLLQGMLESAVKNGKPKQLVEQIGTILSTVSSMLDALLDINRIDAGVMPVRKTVFRLDSILERLSREFSYQAQSKRLELRVVPSHQLILSDPDLLEQILRNLLANAFKYTSEGKVLLGCRRCNDALQIQVWDTGIGISEDDIGTIFEEYRRIDRGSNGSSRGLGLGLSIVERLTTLLGHRIGVASHPGRGTVFSLTIDLAGEGAAPQAMLPAGTGPEADVGVPAVSFDILVIEDEPEVLELLAISLKGSGHAVKTAQNATSVNRILVSALTPPDIIIADYSVADHMNGLQLALKFREKFGHPIPIIILTGDISTNTIRRITEEDCFYLHKPIASRELELIIQRLAGQTPAWRRGSRLAQSEDAEVVSIIEDDAVVGEGLQRELTADGRTIRLYSSSEDFLEDYTPGGTQCLILDAYLPGMNGVELLHHLNETGKALPTIIITGLSDTQIAVDAMKAGAINLIKKPINSEELKESIKQGLQESGDKAQRDVYLADVAKRYASLTTRQVEVMDLVLAGHPSKNIATDLGISQRTVEKHRAAIMTKTNSTSLPALARFAWALAEINRARPSDGHCQTKLA